MYRLILIFVLCLGLVLGGSDVSGNTNDSSDDPALTETDNTNSDNTTQSNTENNNYDNTNTDNTDSNNYDNTNTATDWSNTDNTNADNTSTYDNTNPNASETFISPIDGTEAKMPQRDKSTAGQLLNDADKTNYDNTATPSSMLSKAEKEELEKIRAAAREAEEDALLFLEKKKGEKSSIDTAIEKWNAAGMGEDQIRAQWLSVKKHIDEGESEKAVEIAMAAIEQATNSNLEGSGMALAFHAMAEAQRAKGEDKKAERYQMFSETAVKNIEDKEIRREIEGLIQR